MNSEFRTGYLAVIGRPNVGKSTLTNRLVGAKVSITSKKAQTTRHRIHGVLTTDDAQFIFVDTPGFQMTHKNALNRLMNRSVTSTFADVDVILLVVEAGRWGNGETEIAKMLPADKPVVLVINKIDRLADKAEVLPFIAKVSGLHDFAEIVPLSAEKGLGTDALLAAVARYLPVSPPVFEADDITDRSERFMASEILREKLFRNLGEELPYGIAVEIEKFEQEGDLRRIHAAVIVDRDGHRSIVIGKAGERLKRISTDARKEMETLFGGKVWLETWVKVKGGWADDERALKSLGYD
ncbi:GTPase Era [Sulfuritalea hydrogenivorans]|jgi:GTP-binding protein Era|uniref:GTPase Era n=1 Tax=Sulfuritalea hydrogenivorans sk43H TaxID=1223802 RepID=W0SGU0_9PROT|nr:GTPase Era [Sulfuritalea hydrogenivorans]MDK9712686.1 GTPase Era [Sulfuritalea sp.]BAO29975.1 GTP-binding protein Era [Sulfuritalea hydrogenivorans sk43H]